MKSRTLFIRSLAIPAVILALIVTLTKCQKGPAGDSLTVKEIKTGPVYEAMRQHIREQLKGGVLIANLTWEKAPETGNKVESSCIATAVFKGGSYVS